MNVILRTATAMLFATSLSGCIDLGDLLEKNAAKLGGIQGQSTDVAANGGGTTTGGTTTGGTTTGGTTTGGTTTGGTTTGGSGGTTTGGTSTGGTSTGGTSTGGTSTGGTTTTQVFVGNAIGQAVQLTCDASSMAACKPSIKLVNMSPRDVVKLALQEAGDGKSASATVAGYAFVQNLAKQPQEPGETQTEYANNQLAPEASVWSINEIRKNNNGPTPDSFYFFEAETVTINRQNGLLSTQYYSGVDGNWAPPTKVRNAEYKGQGSLEFIAWNDDGSERFDVDGFGTSVITANLDERTLDARIQVSRVFDEATDTMVSTGLGVGYSLEIQDAGIDGSKFSDGTFVLKDESNNSAANFSDSKLVGGFFGDDAQYAAGVFGADGVGVTNHVGKRITVEGDFWGTRTATVVNTGGTGTTPVSPVDMVIAGTNITIDGPAPTYGQSQIALRTQFSLSVETCSTPSATCVDGIAIDDVGDPIISQANAKRQVAVKSIVTINPNAASVVVDDVAYVSNVTKQQSSLEGDHYYFSDTTNADSEPLSDYVDVRKPAGQDDFFFFDTGKNEVVTASSFSGSSVHGVYGNLTPVQNVKTATYKGKASGDIDNASGEFAYNADTLITADLNSKKVDTKITITSQIDRATGASATNAFSGAEINLTGSDIYGNTFGGGALSVTKNGNVMTTFDQANTAAVGGFYGANAEHVAGVLNGIGGSTATANDTFIDSEFWGAKQP